LARTRWALRKVQRDASRQPPWQETMRSVTDRAHSASSYQNPDKKSDHRQNLAKWLKIITFLSLSEFWRV
jgi:hypothetical protein